MNTRFAVAAHILTFLQRQEGQPVSSERLARSVNTHPSLIRRLVSQLNRAGLTRSEMGAGGGTLLARPAERITLLDVHRAMDPEGFLLSIHEDPDPECEVGRSIGGLLDLRLRKAEDAFEAELAGTTIAELATATIAKPRRKRD